MTFELGNLVVPPREGHCAALRPRGGPRGVEDDPHRGIYTATLLLHLLDVLVLLTVLAPQPLASHWGLQSCYPLIGASAPFLNYTAAGDVLLSTLTVWNELSLAPSGSNDC